MDWKLSQLNPFGVEVTGLDAVDRDEAALLKDLLARHGVVVLRDRFISDAQFVALLAQLGSLTFTVGETPVAHQPELNIVTNVGRSRPPRSVFHTDTSYISRPPAYTALKAVTLPQSGGETLFVNQYSAYETLPDWVKQTFAEAKVQHVVSGLTLSDREETESWHPLFIRHPISNRTALYLSTPERCQRISNSTVTDSQRAIRLLYKHSIRPHRTYRHHWQPGDIVLWDNRCTMHRADHSCVVGDRVLHRGIVAGEPLQGISTV